MNITLFNYHTKDFFMATPSSQAAITKATFIGLIAPLLWSTYPTLTYIIGEMPPFQLLTIGFTVSFITSLFIWKFRKTPLKKMFNQPLKYWFIGILGILGFNSFYILSLYFAPRAEAFLLTSIWPFLALIMSAIFLKEKLHKHHIIGCVMGVIGIYFIAVNKGVELEGGTHIYGYIAAIIAAFIWAIYSLVLRANPFPQAEFIGSICGATAIGALILHTSLESWVPVTTDQYLPLILIGVGSMGLSYYCWNYGVQHGDLRSLNNLVYLGHFSTISLLMLVGQAKLTFTLVSAFVFIIGGALIGSSSLFAKHKK